MIAKIATGDRKQGEGEEMEYTVSCPRYGLWKCLHEIVGSERIRYRKVVGVDVVVDVKGGRGRGRPKVRFADGEEEEADLVIGADGVRSVVKKALFGDDDERLYAPRYE